MTTSADTLRLEGRRAGRRSVPVPARVGARVGAGVTDLVCAVLVVAAVAGLVRLAGGPPAVAAVVAALVVGVAREVALALTTWSPGGLLAQVRVVDARTGGPARLALAAHAGLTLVTVVGTLGVGAYLLMRSAAADAQGRGWHDHLSGIRVVPVLPSPAALTAAAGSRPAAAVSGGAAGHEAAAVSGGAAGHEAAAVSGGTGGHEAAAVSGGAAGHEAELEALFGPDRYAFSASLPGSPETAMTFGTPPAPPPSGQAVIDSVPWVEVPVPLDVEEPERYRSSAEVASPVPVVPVPVAPAVQAAPTAGPVARPGAVGSTTERIPVVREAGPSEAVRAQDVVGPETESATPGPAAPPAPPPPPALPAPASPGAAPGSPVQAAMASPVPGHGPRRPAPIAVDSALLWTSAGSVDGPAPTVPEPSPVPALPPEAGPDAAALVAAQASAGSEPTTPPGPGGAPGTGPAPGPVEAPRPAPAAPEPAAGRRPARRRRARHARPAAEDPLVTLRPAAGGPPVLLRRLSVVGRDPENISQYPEVDLIALEDPSRSVSKTHAMLAPTRDGLWVMDLHSTNGTRVQHGGRLTRLEPEVLVPAPTGSVLQLGRVAFHVGS